MKKRQLTAILLSAVLSFSCCMPLGSFSAMAADAGGLTVADDPGGSGSDEEADLEILEAEEPDAADPEGSYSASDTLEEIPDETDQDGSEAGGQDDAPAADESISLPGEDSAAPGGDQEEQIPEEAGAVSDEDPQEQVPEEAGAVSDEDPQEQVPEEADPVSVEDPQAQVPEEAGAVSGGDPQKQFSEETGMISDGDPQEQVPEEAAPVSIEDPQEQVPEEVAPVFDGDPQEQAPEEAVAASDEEQEAQLPGGSAADAADSAGTAADPWEDFASAADIQPGDSVDVAVTDENPFAFFRFQPAEDGIFTLESESSIDTLAALYLHDPDTEDESNVIAGEYVYLTSDDDGGENDNFRLTYSFSAGKTYYFRTGKNTETAGNFRVTLKEQTFYVVKPAQAIYYGVPGTEVTLQVEAYSNSALTYTWYSETEPLKSGSSNTYDCPADGSYTIYCTVTDESGNEDTVEFYVEPGRYWSVYAVGDTRLTVEPGQSQLLQAAVTMEEGYEDLLEQYSLTWTWMDVNGDVLQEGGTEYTVPEVDGFMQVTCRVEDQYGHGSSVSYQLMNPGHLDVYPSDSPWNTSRTIQVEPGEDCYLNVADYTSEGQLIHYTWYDEEDQILFTEDSDYWGGSSYVVSDVHAARTIRCHAGDDNGNSTDLYFYIEVMSYLTVYPDGAEEGETSLGVDIKGQDSVTLRTIAYNSAGKAVTYQWMILSMDRETGSWTDEYTNIPGAVGDSYTVDRPDRYDQYCCRVRDEYGNSETAFFYLYADVWMNAYVSEVDWSRTLVTDVAGLDEITLAPYVESDDMDRVTYQWAVTDGDTEQKIEGATGSTYTVASPSNGSAYVCTVSDSYGDSIKLYYYFRHNNQLYVYVSVEGDLAYSQSMTIDPRDAESFTLSPVVTADDMTRLSYLWVKSYEYEETQCGSGASLTIDHAPANGTSYSCTVSDQYGNAQTVTYYFKVDTRLAVYPEGASSSTEYAYCAVGGQDSVTLHAVVEAEEGTQLTWQWRGSNGASDPEDGSGAMTSTGEPSVLSCTVKSPQNDQVCFIEVWDAYGNSRQATFYFQDEAPAMDVYPGGELDEEGRGVVTFTSSDNSCDLYVFSYNDYSGNLVYSWKDENGNALADERGNAYTDSWARIFQPRDGAAYSCEVTSRNGYRPSTVRFILRHVKSDADLQEEELANASANAVPISVNGEADVEVTEEHPYAWFRFTPETGGKYEFYSTQGSDGYCDTFVDLYNGQGYRLGSDDDSAGNGQFTISRDLAAGETYYFRTRAFSGGSARFTVHLLSGEVSDWLSDYSYRIEEDRIVLTSYKGKADSVTVPGSAVARGKTFRRIELGVGLGQWRWASGITSLSFESGVVVPEEFYNLLDSSSLRTVDLSAIDFSKVTSAYSLFGNGESLQEIRTPVNVQVKIALPAAFTGTDGKVYTSLPQGLSSSMTLTKAAASDWLSDYRYEISGNRIRLTDYFGDGREITVPGSGTVGGTDYHTVELSPQIWDMEVRTLSFEPGVVVPEDCSSLFAGMFHLASVDIGALDWSNVTNMSSMFSGCFELKELDLSGLKTSKVTDMNEMFYACESLTSLDLKNFDTKNVTNASRMFSQCSSLSSLKNMGLDLSKATDLSYMFSDCYELEELDLRGLKTKAVENTAGMFTCCYKLKKLDLRSFGTSSLTNVRRMFRNCSKLQELNLSSFDGSAITHDGGMFHGTSIGTLYAPTGLSRKIYLPAVYQATNGALFGTLPRNLTKSMTILWARDLKPGESGDPVPAAGVTLAATSLRYTGKALKPAVTVKSGDTTLKRGTDYTVAYANNINVGTATVTVTGKGDFTGTIKKTFKITKGTQSLTVKTSAASVAVGKTATVSITGAKGKKSFKSSNTAVATVNSAGKVTAKKVGTVKITAASAATASYNAASKTVTINVVPAATSSLKAANQARGIKLTWKTVTGANGYIIYRNNKKVKTISPGSTVTWADTAANTNGTKYVYKVFAKASTGTSTLSRTVTCFRVAQPSISSVSNSDAKKATVKYSRNTKANGYEIQCCLKKNFASGVKTVTVSRNATVSSVISGLQKNKTYYFRVRTFKKAGSSTYYSAYSPVKSVKIKK